MNDNVSEKAKAHTRYYGLDGEQKPGVTTVLYVLNKPFLIPWANKLGLQGIDSSKYRDAMAGIGTLTHQMIMDHLTRIKTVTSDYSASDIGMAENCFLSYLEWEKRNPIKPVLVEQPLVSDIYGYGGTPDCIAYNGDNLELLDFKTGKAIYPEMFYQVAAYVQLAKEHGYEITSARILRIGRDDNEGFEERLTKRWDKEFELFRHCLSIYNLQKELKRG